MSAAELAPGSEVLVKRANQGRFRFYGYEYTKIRVTRVTKARIFVKSTFEGAKEREFNRATLVERSGSDSVYNRAELVIDPAEIEKIRAQIAAEKARKALEQTGLVALVQLRKRFDPDAIGSRSDNEIREFVAAVANLETLIGASS